MKFIHIAPLLAACLIRPPADGLAADWPQYLGPNRDAVYPGKALTQAWPEDGPKGHLAENENRRGVVRSRRFRKKTILFHEKSGQDVIECLNANTGETIWTNRYPTSYVDSFGSGAPPRATPAIVDGRVYTMSAQGIVVCTDMANGKTVWKVNTQKTYRAQDGFFGMACSPLIEGNAVLLNIGGTGAGIVALLDKTNGKLLWKSLDDEASYSSPVISTL